MFGRLRLVNVAVSRLVVLLLALGLGGRDRRVHHQVPLGLQTRVQALHVPVPPVLGLRQGVTHRGDEGRVRVRVASARAGRRRARPLRRPRRARAPRR